MEFEKIYASRGVTGTPAARRSSSLKEDTSDAFARMLQNLRESKPANSRERSDAEGDTVITRVLADGTVITQIYKGTKLISETMTRGSNPEAGKAILSTRMEKLHPDALDDVQNPLLASKAAQSSVATAALVSTML